MPHRYSIIGAGALGGYYGARLHSAGFRVTFLLHSDFDHVRQHGFRVDSVEGNFSIAQPCVVARAADLPPADVVLVALKSTRNHLFAELLPAAVGPNSIVLLMQNGLGVEKNAAAVLEGQPVLGGLAFVCAHKVGPGHVRHLDYGAVRIGQYTADGTAAGVTEAARSVVADFQKAGVAADVAGDLVQARWQKLVWNVPYNGLCVIHRCSTDDLMRDPATRARCAEIMREVVAAATACGHPIDAGFVDMMLASTEKMTPYDPSMKLDFDKGRPLEIESIYAEPLRAAAAAGVSCPRITELYDQLREIGS